MDYINAEEIMIKNREITELKKICMNTIKQKYQTYVKCAKSW